MTLRLLIAEALVRMANRIVPRERSDWLAAMVGELDELDSVSAILDWAIGCLIAAIGWRLRGEIGYAAAVLLACAASTIASLVCWWLTSPVATSVGYGVFQQALVVVAALAVSIAFPRRALLSPIIIALAFNFGAVPRFAIDVLCSARSPEQALGLAGQMALFVVQNILLAFLTGCAVWGWDKARRASPSAC